jgi:uncharacterized membrane protein YfcA
LAVGTVAFIIAIYTLHYLRRFYVRKRKAGYRFDLTDIHWNFPSGIRMQVIAFVCGLVAGLLGMGEGAIFVILFTQLRRDPRVA